MDASTGKVLLQKDMNLQLYPASTTKILTAIIAIEKLDLTSKLTASRSAIMAFLQDIQMLNKSWRIFKCK